jgi:hypothetical protein
MRKRFIIGAAALVVVLTSSRFADIDQGPRFELDSGVLAP